MGVRKTLSVENVDRIGGGVGVTELHHLMSKDEFYGTGKMFAKVVLHPGNTIGWHEHIDEVEYYYILSGEGDFTNPDKSVSHVGPGDFCTMNPNQGHAIANTGKEDLVFMALILYTK